MSYFELKASHQLILYMQIVSAIQIAWDPTSNQQLKRQAYDYVNQLRQEPQAWLPCLSIFTQIPQQPEVVRLFCLEIVNNAVQAGLVDQQGLTTVKEQLMTHMRRSYGGIEGPGTNTNNDSPPIENKIAQTITYLFASFYGSGWETCIDDLLNLTTTSSGMRDNLQGTVFYLRVLNSIHDEIGDQLLSRSRGEQDRANNLKDLVRQRDVQKIANSWQEILTQWRTRNDVVAELCLKAIGKWVSWVDISFVVNQRMLGLLFEQLERAQKVQLEQGEEKARDAAVDVFTETVAKKMPAQDKISMIAFLNLDSVVSQLIACPPLSERRGSSTYDVDLAETVAKLVNTTIIDIVKVLETENQNPDVSVKAEQMLQAFLPHLLRFFSDEYDEVCSTVLNAMNDVLAFLRRTSQGEGPSPQRAVMLLPILKAIFGKMRYDETASWGDEDDRTDEAEFQDLRKRLGALQQTIAAVDERLFMDAVTGLVHDTFERLRTQGSNLNWRDLDLALHEMYMYGELAMKAGGLYQKNKPNSLAAEKLVDMMLQMVQSSTGSFGHPAIQLQYMEICVRYSSFFDKHTQFIQPVLSNFLQLAHHSSSKVRTRCWYLLQRFSRQLRMHVGKAVGGVVQSLQDLLVVKAELPADQDADDMSSEEESAADSTFTNQLYLFEAVGCICGAGSVPEDKQVQYVQAIMQPLFTDIEITIVPAKAGNEQAILQVHHDLMALGTLGRGFSDFTPGASAPAGSEPALQVRQAFARVSEVALVALDALKSSFQIRTAARFVFSRLIGMAAPQMLQQLPQWVEGLLTESSSRDEMALFLRLLDQVIYGFKNEISGFLDSLFTGLLQRVFAGFSTATAGTDDEIELAELKREYLNFLMVILGNDLGGVLISATNQPFFETVINTIEHFTKDADDFPTAKMAFQLLARMCVVWGGPDVVLANGGANENTAQPRPTLPGFDQFMISRFSPLCWELPSNPSFNPKDAQARQVLIEAAGLQKTICCKAGEQYLKWLRDDELRKMGMNDAMINDYLNKLTTLDMKSFKTFFAKFISLGGRV